MTRKAKKTPLTEFERDSIWMSYRYCIGRSTIAAHHRATEIADFLRTKEVSKDRMSFNAEDINQSINDILRMTHNFWYEDYTMQHNGDFRPWMAFMEFIKETGINNASDLSTYVNIHYNPFKKEKFSHEVDPDKRKSYADIMEVEDLKIWSDLAAWMDNRCHHIAHCHFEGEDIDVEYFDSYKFYFDKNGFEIKAVKVPVDTWDGQVDRWIEEEYIISID